MSLCDDQIVLNGSQTVGIWPKKTKVNIFLSSIPIMVTERGLSWFF